MSESTLKFRLAYRHTCFPMIFMIVQLHSGLVISVNCIVRQLRFQKIHSVIHSNVLSWQRLSLHAFTFLSKKHLTILPPISSSLSPYFCLLCRLCQCVGTHVLTHARRVSGVLSVCNHLYLSIPFTIGGILILIPFPTLTQQLSRRAAANVSAQLLHRWCKRHWHCQCCAGGSH